MIAKRSGPLLPNNFEGGINLAYKSNYFILDFKGIYSKGSNILEFNSYQKDPILSGTQEILNLDYLKFDLALLSKKFYSLNFHDSPSGFQVGIKLSHLSILDLYTTPTESYMSKITSIEDLKKSRSSGFGLGYIISYDYPLSHNLFLGISFEQSYYPVLHSIAEKLYSDLSETFIDKSKNHQNQSKDHGKLINIGLNIKYEL